MINKVIKRKINIKILMNVNFKKLINVLFLLFCLLMGGGITFTVYFEYKKKEEENEEKKLNKKGFKIEYSGNGYIREAIEGENDAKIIFTDFTKEVSRQLKQKVRINENKFVEAFVELNDHDNEEPFSFIKEKGKNKKWSWNIKLNGKLCNNEKCTYEIKNLSIKNLEKDLWIKNLYIWTSKTKIKIQLKPI
jgi:hypothetical protein